MVRRARDMADDVLRIHHGGSEAICKEYSAIGGSGLPGQAKVVFRRAGTPTIVS